MLDNNVINSSSAWPFVEIRKLLKERNNLIKKKNKIVFQTGLWAKWFTSYWNFWRSCKNFYDD